MALRCELHGPLNALSQSPDGERVVLAGRDVLKIVQLVDGTLVQGQNLRIMKKHLNFSSTDVHWHPLESFKNWLATAATNGAVVLWDLNMTDMKKTARIISEHTRTVNRVQFHSTEPTLLLSGSQDGTMKMWDLRTRGPSILTFDGRAESVRDVQFNPQSSTGFAAAFENGTVQIWDTRQPSACEYRIAGHQGPAFCLSWHPEDRTVLASGGRDKIIKVWRSGTAKPESMASVNTIASVGRVKWRPNHRYHLASCSLVADNSVHIWDLQRPFIPLASFTDHKDLATDIEWAHGTEGSAIFSCSKDKFVAFNPISIAEFPLDDVPKSAVGWSVSGDLVCVSSNEVVDTPGRPLTHQISEVANTGYFNRSKPAAQVVPTMIPYEIRPAVCIMTASSAAKAARQDFAHAFKHQAINYMLTSSTITPPEMCSHNANVAQECGDLVTAQTWRILGTLLVSADSKVQDGMFADMQPFIENDEGDESQTPPPGQAVKAVERRSAGMDSWGSYKESEKTGGSFAWETTVHGGRTLFSAGSSSMSSLSSVDTDEEGHESDGREDDMRDVYFEVDAPREMVLSNEMADTLTPIPSPLIKPATFDWSRILLGISPPQDDVLFAGSENISAGAPAPASEVSQKRHVRANAHAPPFKSISLIKELLHFYAEQGVVQMCVSILGVLGEQANAMELDSRLKEQWLHSYIEILHRMRMFVVATHVIKTATVQSVNELNTDSTTVYMACGSCGKPMLKQGPMCERCRISASLCSLCHQTVRGTFTWCQGCGHGGHIHHIKQWFATNDLCPAGCNHKCQQ